MLWPCKIDLNPPVAFCYWSFRVDTSVVVLFVLCLKVTEWPPIGKIAAHMAYKMFSWYKYLIVSLVYSHLGFWSGNLFLVAPFPDLCLLVRFSYCFENLSLLG